MKAILSYSRLPYKDLIRLKKGFDKLNIQIKWITSHNQEQSQASKIFPDANQFRWASYRFNESWLSRFDKDLFDALLGTRKNIALPVVERYGPHEGGSLEAEMRLMHDFSLAHNMINDAQPDLVIFEKSPESGIEYCLYLLSKHFGIKTVFTRKGIFPHSCIFCTDMDTAILDKNWRPMETIVPVCNLKNPGNELSSLTIQKIKEIRKGDQYSIPDYMRNQGVSASNQNKLVKFNPKYSLVGFIKGLQKKGTGDFFKKRLLSYSENLVTSLDRIDWSKKSIFFPLHYQPEASSMPAGGEYVNQLKIIKLISDNLSSGEQLIIKEHPSTFTSAGKTNSNYRNKSFYNWILKMPNVKLVSVYTRSSYLMDKCIALVTVSGAAGIEAMIREKPTFVFGNASYLNGPGIFYIKDEADFLSALEKIKFKFSYNEVEKFIKSIEGCAYHLNIFPYQTKNPNETMQIFYVTVLLEGLKVLFGDQ